MDTNAPRCRPANVVVVDLSEVALSHSHGTLTATVRTTGQHLAQLRTTPSRPVRASVAELLDDALGSARLFHAGRWLSVAFYNPATARIALGPTPAGVVLWAGGPIELPAAGAPGLWCPGTGELHVADLTAVCEQPGPEQLWNRVQAHEQWHHRTVAARPLADST